MLESLKDSHELNQYVGYGRFQVLVGMLNSFTCTWASRVNDGLFTKTLDYRASDGIGFGNLY